jgi:hypothetical protein
LVEAVAGTAMRTPTTHWHHSRTGLRYASDLTDAEWALLEPPLPRRSRPGDIRRLAAATLALADAEDKS